MQKIWRAIQAKINQWFGNEPLAKWIEKEIWNDGYSAGLKDSDQIQMRDALERILAQCERHIAEDNSWINARYIRRVAEEGLGLSA